MVQISCSAGEKSYLKYTGNNQQTVRIENVAKYFLYSPNNIPVTNYTYTNYLGQNSSIIKAIFSSLEPKLITVPGFTAPYLVPHGWNVDYINGEAYMTKMNRYYGQYPGFLGQTEQEVINSLYPLHSGYNTFASPLTHKYRLTRGQTIYRPSSDFIHSNGFYSNIDPNISTNRYPNGEPIYVQPALKPVFGKWVLQLFDVNDQSLGNVFFNAEPTIATGCLAGECPPDTCPIECGNTMCCYNDLGVSIHEYPL